MKKRLTNQEIMDMVLTLPELSADEQKLVDAYVAVGTELNKLPYTRHMDEVVEKWGCTTNDTTRRNAYLLLLNLQKKGRLPRVFGPGISY